MARAVRVLVLDVDGTLTDGRLFVDPVSGQEGRAYFVHDGFGIRLFQEAGGLVIFCTGKAGGSVTHRAALLGIEHVIQGSQNKVADVEALLTRLGRSFADTAVMGDDLPDAALMQRAALAIAPANARPEVRAVANLVTQAAGGQGAVREAIEFILRETGAWDDVLQRWGLEP